MNFHKALAAGRPHFWGACVVGTRPEVIKMAPIIRRLSRTEWVTPFVIATGHSRFPVYEGERDKVIGILMAKDLLKLQRAPELNLRTLLRPAVFVPESKRLNELLRDFRSNRNHLAMVIDEFGQTAGLITIEDVLEEIVGEIEDEFDEKDGDNSVYTLADGSHRVAGDAAIASVNPVFGTLDASLLVAIKARAVVELTAALKMEPKLAQGIYPSWAVKNAGSIDVWISVPKTFSAETVSNELRSRNVEIMPSLYRSYRVLSLRVATTRLSELATLPFIEYVQAAPHEDQLLNYNSMFASRVNVIKASLANGGKNLNGQGVVVGIGDDGDPQTHLDFTGRLINRVGEKPRAHASHVTGTVGGAGIIQELYAGYAPKSTLLNQVSSNIISNAAAYVQDHGMVITNNSYGAVVNDCSYSGLYDLYSRVLDQQAEAMKGRAEGIADQITPGSAPSMPATTMIASGECLTASFVTDETIASFV